MSKKKNASVTEGDINAVKEKGPGIFKRLGRKIAGNIPLLLCFLIPVIVMLLVFIQRGIFPFGERCFCGVEKKIPGVSNAQQYS